MSEENKEPELPTGEVGKETSEEGGFTNPDAHKEVALDNEMKKMFVDYIGKKHDPEDGVVTVAMAIATMAQEFPEFLMVLAEENWIRGYRQGVEDSETGVRAALEQAGIDPSEQKIIVPPQAPEESSGEDE